MRFISFHLISHDFPKILPNQLCWITLKTGSYIFQQTSQGITYQELAIHMLFLKL